MNRVVVHPGRENLIDHLALINVFLNRTSAQVSGACAVCAYDVVMVTSNCIATVVAEQASLKRGTQHCPSHWHLQRQHARSAQRAVA